MANDPVNFIDLNGLSKTEGKNANKNRPMNVGEFNKNSDPNEVRKAMQEAKDAGKLKHFKKLKGLLKVILRNAPKAIIPPFLPDILLEHLKRGCEAGSSASCKLYMDFTDDEINDPCMS